MSDEYYRQRAASRTRMIWLVIGLVAAAGCLYLSITRIFWDECTGSFQRSPQAVAESYLQAIQDSDQQQPRRCWVDSAFLIWNRAVPRFAWSVSLAPLSRSTILQSESWS